VQEDIDSNDLAGKAAATYGVSPALLKDLLGLERTFTNFATPGAKAEFARQVAAIIGQAAGSSGNE
jgi:hypothetical protein